MLVRLAGPPLLLVSALDPSSHSRPRRTVPADCALPTYPVFAHAVFAHAAPIHTATFTRLLWDCPISLLRRKTHIRAYTPVTPRVASLSARQNDDRAHIGTQTGAFAFLCSRTCRFDAHLGTQTGRTCCCCVAVPSRCRCRPENVERRETGLRQIMPQARFSMPDHAG